MLGTTTLGAMEPIEAACDGRDVWTTAEDQNAILRVRASDGRVLETWTAANPFALVSAMGRILVTNPDVPGRLYSIDPRLPAGAATTVASNLGDAAGIAFDGARFWTANFGGSVSIVTPGASLSLDRDHGHDRHRPLRERSTTARTSGLRAARAFGSWTPRPRSSRRSRSGNGSAFPAFDGTNVWASGNNSVSVVRASNGAVLATLTGNGLNGSNAVAFDGERVLVTNGSGGSVSLWKAGDLTPLGDALDGREPGRRLQRRFQFLDRNRQWKEARAVLMAKLLSAKAAALLSVSAALLFGASTAALSVCGPFADVSDAAFCPFVLEIFTLGITTGTTPATYDPGGNVSRLQMAAFLSRTVDRTLERGGRRVALKRLWNVHDPANLPMTTLDSYTPAFVAFDGADLWVGEPAPSSGPGRLARVSASDGRKLETWTGLSDIPQEIVVAMGRIFIATSGMTAGLTGRLMQVDPSQAAGAASTVATNLPRNATGLAFDGGRFWTTNQDATVSIVAVAASTPWTVTTVTVGSADSNGILFDGNHVWVTDFSSPKLLELDGSGAVLQTVTVGSSAANPVFDGSNIWIPNFGDSTVSVVRASSGAVLATLTGNGLAWPGGAAFDGQRVLVTNEQMGAVSVSLWKAADLTPIGTFPLPPSGVYPFGSASDGTSFWISLVNYATPFVGHLVRF